MIHSSSLYVSSIQVAVHEIVIGTGLRLRLLLGGLDRVKQCAFELQMTYTSSTRGQLGLRIALISIRAIATGVIVSVSHIISLLES